MPRASSPFLPFSRTQPSRPAPQNYFQALLRSPFTLSFLLLAWGLFFRMVRSNGWIPESTRQELGFIATKWNANPFDGFLASHVGIIVQHSWGQIIYITILLLLFGVRYESREGPLRTLVVFYGACAAGVATLVAVMMWAFVAGPHSWAWYIAHTSWSGASVGAFGLLGAYVATSARPQRLIGLWLLYETVVEWTLVPSLAVFMHAAGFSFGFALSWIAHMDDQASYDTAPNPVTDEPPKPAP